MSKQATKTPQALAEEASAEHAEAAQQLAETEAILAEMESEWSDLQADIADGLQADYDEYREQESRLRFQRQVTEGQRAKVARLASAVPNLDSDLAEAVAPLFASLLHGVETTACVKVALPRAEDAKLGDRPRAYVIQDRPTKHTKYGAMSGEVEVVLYRPSQLYRGFEQSDLRDWSGQAEDHGYGLDVRASRIVRHTEGLTLVDRARVRVHEAHHPGGPILTFGKAEAEGVARTITSRLQAALQDSRRGYPTGSERQRVVNLRSVEIESSEVDADGVRRSVIEVTAQANVNDQSHMAAPVGVVVEQACRDLRSYLAGFDSPCGLIERAEVVSCAFDVEHATERRGGERWTPVVRATVATRDGDDL